ncbi:MAG: hypothetical protein ACLQPV_01145 [Vulcanimicrobiaceae bacterium]
MSLKTPLFVLVGRALQLFGRRWLLFSVVTLGAIAAEAVVFVLWHSSQATLFANSIFIPLQTAIVYAFVAADSLAEPVTAGRTWARALERAWAVIVIDFIATLIQIWGAPAGGGSDPLAIVLNVVTILIVVTLVFADAAAVIDDEEVDSGENAVLRGLLLVPRSLARSVTLVLVGGFVIRAFFLFGLEIATELLSVAAGAGLHSWHAGGADFWAQCAIPTLATAPIAVATAVFYIDAGEFESSLGGDAEDDAWGK